MRAIAADNGHRPGYDRSRLLVRVAAACILVSAAALAPARADIYTWTDESGRLNVSNLKPSDNVSLTRVYREDPDTPARAEAARQAARDSELRTLASRVQELDRELDTASHRESPPIVSSTILPPAPPPDPIAVAPPVPEYAEAAPPSSTCDATLYDCTTWWRPGPYPSGMFDVSEPDERRYPSYSRGNTSLYSYGYAHVGAPAPWQPLRPVVPDRSRPSADDSRAPFSRPPRAAD